MADIFSEVDEELRQEKIKEFWDENKYFIIGSILAAIIFTAIFVAWQDWKYKTNMQKTAELYNILDARDVEGLVKYAKNSNAENSVIANFVATSVYINRREEEKALNLLKTIQENRNIDKIYRNLASLIEAKLLLNSDNDKQLANIEKKLKLLSDKNNIWHFSAQETLMLLASKRKDYPQAVKIANLLINMPNIRPNSKERILKLKKLYEIKIAMLENSKKEENN